MQQTEFDYITTCLHTHALECAVTKYWHFVSFFALFHFERKFLILITDFEMASPNIELYTTDSPAGATKTVYKGFIIVNKVIICCFGYKRNITFLLIPYHKFKQNSIMPYLISWSNLFSTSVFILFKNSSLTSQKIFDLMEWNLWIFDHSTSVVATFALIGHYGYI